MKNLFTGLRLTVVATTLVIGVLPTHAATYIWNVATPGVNNWNVDGNWNISGFPGNADTAVFGLTGTAANSNTVNNVVSVNTIVNTLNYTNTTAAQWHVTQIPSGVTLNTTNLTVGFTTAVDGLVTLVSMNGSGTFGVFGTTTIGDTGASAVPSDSILDMSGLSNFVYSASSATFAVGQGARGAANLNLAAASNSITAGTLSWNANSSSSSASGTVKLGTGTNIINAGTITMAANRSTSTLSFYNSTGGLRLRGTGGTDTDRAALNLGNRNVNSSSGTTTGTLSLNGHPVDAKFSTMTLAQANNSAPTGAQGATAVVNFDNGTIDATTINMAVSSVNAFNTALATFNVNSNATLGTIGTLVVGSGGISLANQGALGTSTGNLNIIGGAVICAGPITKAAAAGTGNIGITNGSLTAAGTVGTTVIPINSLVVSNASLTLAGNVSVTNVEVSTLNAIAGANNTINISSLSGVSGYPIEVPLIKYTTGSGDLTTFVLGSLPAANPPFVGVIVNDTADSRIDVLITSGPTPPPPTKTVVWDGEVSGAWDTTTTNWTTGGVLTNYNAVTASGLGDNAIFDDTLLGTTNVNLTAALTPNTLTVNSATNYYFTGSGKITGSIGLTKNGTGTLTFANSTANDFSGPIALNAGTLAYDQGVDATAANVISGAGAIVKNHANTLTLSGASSFSGGLTVNAGAVRANALNAAGTAPITVNSGGTFVVGAALTNSITLSNAVIGTSLTGGFTMATNSGLTIAANSTNVIYSADPQSPVTSFQFLVDADLHGNGTILCINAVTNSPDSGQGIRFRNTNAISDFSGTIIYTNGNKGELLMLTPVGATFSPIGTGKLVLYGGTYNGGNTTLAPADGTAYCELNLRNNGPGSIILGNNVTVAGSGAVILNALAGSGGITMGNLTIGAGQELIGYKATGTPVVTNVAIFPTVTLTGGNATFSPHSPTFGATTQFGTDFSLGNISEQTAGSGITMAGLGILTLTGANTYSGATTVSNGVLYLSGSASIASSPNIAVAGGARLDVTGLSSTFTLGAAQTLSNITSTAVIGGNANATSGTLSLTYAASTPSFNVANGTLTLGASTTFKVNNTGAALAKGSYKVISGSVAGTAPSSVTVGGNGIATPATPSLQINGGELFLVVPNSAPVIARIVTNSTSAGITWKIAVSSLSAAAGWSDPDNDTITLSSVGPTSNLGISVTTDGTNIFYNAPATAEDFFTYTITDGSLTANGTVYLEAAQSAPAPATANQIVKDVNGVPTITFAGIPGRTNVVEASPDLVHWTPISTNVAGGNGLWQVIDPGATNFPSRFYRSYQPYP